MLLINEKDPIMLVYNETNLVYFNFFIYSFGIPPNRFTTPFFPTNLHAISCA